MVVSRHQNVGQNHDLLIANKSFENVGSAVRNLNCIHLEIKRILNVGNVCYHPVQSFVFPALKTKGLKYRKTILHIVLYGCGIWSLVLWEE
jgi:hypothetical protein